MDKKSIEEKIIDELIALGFDGVCVDKGEILRYNMEYDGIVIEFSCSYKEEFRKHTPDYFLIRLNIPTGGQFYLPDIPKDAFRPFCEFRETLIRLLWNIIDIRNDERICPDIKRERYRNIDSNLKTMVSLLNWIMENEE